MEDKYYDALLHVKTGGGQKGFSSSIHYYRYEPTPYEGLNALFKQYQLKETDRVVDFGSGKGRLLFYIHHFFKATVIGVEIDKSLYHEAMENRDRYVKRSNAREEEVEIHHCAAQDYEINSNDNRFYFLTLFQSRFLNIRFLIYFALTNRITERWRLFYIMDRQITPIF